MQGPGPGSEALPRAAHAKSARLWLAAGYWPAQASWEAWLHFGRTYDYDAFHFPAAGRGEPGDRPGNRVGPVKEGPAPASIPS